MKKIQGYLKIIVYESPGGFQICKFQLADDKSRFIFIKGFLSILQPHQLYELTGDFISHSRYGESFDVKEVKLLVPETNQQLVNYFASKLFPTIGPKAAQAIVDHYQTDVVEKIRADFDSLRMIPELKADQCKIIENVLRDASTSQELTNFFTMHGLNINILGALKLKYNDEQIKHLCATNPYVLIDNDQASFKDVDKIFLAFNQESYFTPLRVAYNARVLVNQYCFRSGNTFITLDQLVSLCVKHLTNIEKQQILDGLYYAKTNKILKFANQRIYDTDVYEGELIISYWLHGLNTMSNISLQKTQDLIMDVATQQQVIYNHEQTQAILNVILHNLNVIIGGPGTGKTTIVNGIIKTLQRCGYERQDILLCAPTGKAAKRLSDKTGVRAATIHKLLKWDPNKNEFSQNQTNPINGRVLIVDEMSMVDTQLFAAIATAGATIEKLILIGDTNQLPSVSCGNVLDDIIKAETFMVNRLTEVHRQQSGNEIVNLSYEIINGTLNPTRILDLTDVMFYQADTQEAIAETLLTLLSPGGILNQESLLNWQVIAPMYNGVGGIIGLNTYLQQILNPISSTANRNVVNLGVSEFRIGDKVMQTKNRPEHDVYNGDVGIIRDIKLDADFKKQILVEYDQTLVTYTKDMFFDLNLAYACSVHKLQGSECDYIVFVVHHSANFMLMRELIYTAVTRAKQKLIIIGQLDVLAHGINKKLPLRHTTLTDQICAHEINS